MSHKPTLTIANLNPRMITMEYLIRGPLAIKAGVLEDELKQGAQKPFKEIVRAHIGDSQAMGQPPITCIRQMLALVSLPSLLTSPDFPEDIKQRARIFLESCRGSSVGSYADPPGLESVRSGCAKYIEQRDNIPSQWTDIFVTNGASTAIKFVLNMFLGDVKCKRPGIMVPIPQYPLYSAAIEEYGMTLIGYYLNESQQWALDMSNLEEVIQEARKYCNPRAIVVINPGNPTGQVLTRKNIEDIIKFASKEKLFILADEVYQENVYDRDSKFHSFKKVLKELGEPYSSNELASFMSISKGWHGECGLRGGYVELINVDPDVKSMYIKCTSAMLCSSVLGQAAMNIVTNPPKKGEASYDQFIKEKSEVLSSLAGGAGQVLVLKGTDKKPILSLLRAMTFKA